MTDASQPTPIRDNVGVALRFTREHWRFVLILAAIGAVVRTLLAGFGMSSLPLALFASMTDAGVKSVVYAALMTAVLAGVTAARAGWFMNGVWVWGAMIVVGFFLGIVMFVISFPVALVLAAGPMAQSVPALEAAGGNQEAVMQIMTQFAENNPVTMLLVMLFYFLVWMYLTSRLYLAAPATLEAGRILTFETWNWTKGAVPAIFGARVLLLFPAAILAGALAYVVAYIVGLNPLAPDPTAVVQFLIYTLFSSFFSFALYFSLEAGLSAALYRHLKPAEAPQPKL